MSITQDGNSLIWDGTVTLTNATDITSGVATLMLTPRGGVGVLPALAAGPPGPPPVFDNVNVTTLTPGSQATGSVSLNVAGGPGVSSHYNLNLSIPQGEAGEVGMEGISDANDLDGTPGAATDQFIPAWNNATAKWKMKPQLCGDVFQAISFTAAAGSTSPQTLATVTVPAQPFDWTPAVSGMAVPTGTANTHVDLRVLMNNASTGQLVGRARVSPAPGMAHSPRSQSR